MEHITNEYGDQRWYLNGKLHRTDGPAFIYANGDQIWYLDGKFHRTDGPAIIYTNGDQAWYLDGKLHRTDGPAVIYNDGDQEWYLDGKRHRTDGPAIIYADGYQAWYFENRKVDQDWMNRYNKLVKKHTILETPVRNKKQVIKIIRRWYHDPKFKCVKKRIDKYFDNMYQ